MDDLIHGSFDRQDQQLMGTMMVAGVRNETVQGGSLTATKVEHKSRIAGAQSQLVKQQMQRTADLTRLTDEKQWDNSDGKNGRKRSSAMNTR